MAQVDYGDISPRTAGYVVKQLLEMGKEDLLADWVKGVSYEEEDWLPDDVRELQEMEKIWEEFPTPFLFDNKTGLDALWDIAKENLILDKFGSRKPLPKTGGTIKFKRYNTNP